MAHVWTTALNELVAICAGAMRAVIPFAEQAHMTWSGPNAYDDWDNICKALFESFVIRSIENSEEWKSSKAVIRYDVRIHNYNRCSFLSLESSQKLAFVSFLTKICPIDTALFYELDDSLNVIGQTELPLEKCSFVLVCGGAIVARELTVNL